MHKDHNTAWNNCLTKIKDDVGDQGFETWFKPIKPINLDAKVLTIQVPSQFFYEYLEEHYVNLLRNVIDSQLGKDYRLEYSVIVDTGGASKQPYTVNLPNNPGRTSGNRYGARSKTNNFTSSFELYGNDIKLNPSYSFENFIEGDCNRLARSAGFAVAKRPGVTSFNPLMLYGGVGLGKTHLVQAIGNEILNGSEKKVVHYVF